MFFEAPKRFITRLNSTNRAWYNFKKAPVNAPELSQMDHVRESLVEIAAVIKEQHEATGKPVYVAGFSQGAFMAQLIGLISRGQLNDGLIGAVDKLDFSVVPAVFGINGCFFVNAVGHTSESM